MNGLKLKRKEMGLTLEALSHQLGVSLNSISLYEKGKRFPRKVVLDKLCKYFNCKIDDLL